MTEMKIEINKISKHADIRGFVFEPIENKQIYGMNNCHVVISNPGAVRGNHYHVRGTEIIAVVGPALFRFKEENEIHDIEIPKEQVYQFIIPPNIPHAIKNIGENANMLIAFNTVEHDAQNPDVIADIVID
jgi:UDP-2-acetamido-2,6-beta-L-arabino-hexul-4-ose reductase